MRLTLDTDTVTQARIFKSRWFWTFIGFVVGGVAGTFGYFYMYIMAISSMIGAF